MDAPEAGWWLVSVASRKAARVDIGELISAIGATGAPPAANLAPQAWLPDRTVLTKGFGSGGIAIGKTKPSLCSNRLEGKLAKLAAPVTELRWFSVSTGSIVFSGGEQIGSLEGIPLDLNSGKLLGRHAGSAKEIPVDTAVCRCRATAIYSHLRHSAPRALHRMYLH